MGTQDIIMVVGLWVMTVGGVLVMPATWRGTNQETITIGSWWPMGQPSLRSGIRTAPVGYFMMCCGAFGTTLHFISQATEGSWNIFLSVTAYVFFGLASLAVMLGVSIFVVNRPKSLVPPHLRDEKGFFGLWGDEIRERREKKQEKQRQHNKQ